MTSRLIRTRDGTEVRYGARRRRRVRQYVAYEILRIACAVGWLGLMYIVFWVWIGGSLN